MTHFWPNIADAAVGHARAVVAFLDDVALRDVDVAEDLDQRRDLDADVFRQADHVDHRPVAANADGIIILLGLDVDVGSAGAEADEQDDSEDADGFTRLIARSAAAAVAARFAVLRQRAPGVVEIDLVLAELFVGERFGHAHEHRLVPAAAGQRLRLVLVDLDDFDLELVLFLGGGDGDGLLGLGARRE